MHPLDKPKKKPVYTKQFLVWWGTYPSRGKASKGSKSSAFSSYKKVLAKHSHDEIMEMLLLYKKSLRATGSIDTPYTKMAFMFLACILKDGKKQKPVNGEIRSWEKLRYSVLRESNGKCCLCGRGVKEGAALQVDHIKPKSLYPELAMEKDNLQVLCSECNIGKSNIDETDWR